MTPEDTRSPATHPRAASFSPQSPWHSGERALQERAGVRAAMERSGRAVIRGYMPDQHRELFEKLPLLIVGSVDAQHRSWASLVVGQPGFVRTPDARTLTVRARPLAGDPLAGNLVPGAPIGLLGIQLETRRRNRVNGSVLAADAEGFTVGVRQSFGNCPQYIWARAPEFVGAPEERLGRGEHAEGKLLSPVSVSQIAAADTFFIATAALGPEASHGVDVSHRGGKPGFVRVARAGDRHVLTWPDFSGNRYFNTLGNLLLNPRAGLLFIDFRAGTLLSLTGTAETLWDGPELAAFAGAERLVRFTADRGVRIERAVPWRWSAGQPAPQIAGTGSWQEVEAAGPR